MATRNKDKNDSRNTIIKLTEEEAKTVYTILYKILYSIEKED